MSLQSRKVYSGIVVLLLLAGGTAWALSSWPANDEGVQVPEELTVASLKKQIEESGPSRETMRNVFEREDLTEEQRQQARRNMGQVWRSMMQERLDEYFAAAPRDQETILDRHIDEWQERMKQMRERREQRERDQDAEGEREDWRERMRQRRAQATPEQRKTRSESRSPDQSARRMAYMSAMRARMETRGIEMPSWGGRGGRGGHGRGG